MSLPLCPFSIAPASILSLPSSSPVVNFQFIGANFRQKAANVNEFLVCFGVSSGKSETKKAKSKHIFEIWCWRAVSCAPLVVVFHRVHWVAGGRLLWLVLLSCRVPRLLPSFLLCLWCITFEYGSISHFKGVLAGFMVRMYVCMG